MDQLKIPINFEFYNQFRLVAIRNNDFAKIVKK